MKPGDLIKFQYDGYHKAYGYGLVTKIEYEDLGVGVGTGWAMFNELLMFRFSEVEMVNEAR